jgi:hypothetical protein
MKTIKKKHNTGCYMNQVWRSSPTSLAIGSASRCTGLRSVSPDAGELVSGSPTQPVHSSPSSSRAYARMVKHMSCTRWQQVLSIRPYSFMSVTNVSLVYIYLVPGRHFVCFSPYICSKTMTCKTFDTMHCA